MSKIIGKAVKKTAQYAGRKAASLCVSLGKAEIKVNGPITKKKVKTLKTLLKSLDEVNPECDSLSLGVGSNGIHGSIGKRITAKRILLVVGSGVSLWFGGKLIYKYCEKKFINGSTQKESEKNESQGATVKPVNQSAEEIRNKAKEEYNGDFDAGQLIGKFIYKGDRVIVYSQRGTGKSVFCIQMAIDISLGRKSLIASEDNGTHTPQTVYYYDLEMNDTDYWNIFGSMDLSSIKNLVLRRGGYYKNVSQWITDVKEVIKTTNGDITIFLDNISGVCITVNADTIRELLLYHLKGIQEEEKKNGRNITFIVVAHTTKQQILAGSMNLENFVDSILGLKEKDSNHLILKADKCRKYNEMKYKNFLLEMKHTAEGYKYDENIGEYKGDVDEPEQSAETPLPTKTVWDGKLSLEKTIEMRDFYQEGVKGHGWKPTAEKFGLSDHKAIEKEFKRLEKYLSDIEETDD